MVRELHAKLLAWRQEVKAPMPAQRTGIQDRKLGRRGQTWSESPKAATTSQ